MPAILDPDGARPYSPTSDPNHDVTSARNGTSLSLRIRTAVHRAELTRLLAEGADPSLSSELALRARQLTSRRHRRALARSMHRTIAEARKPAVTRGQLVIIDRRAVLDAEDAIVEMIDRLRTPFAVRAQGMAILERILTNADRSPLYTKSEPGTLRRMISAATAALDAQSPASHEFTLAA
jgi:hypothetical protein